MSTAARLSILHVDDGRGWGGGQQQVALLAHEQARAGHRVTLSCPGGSPLARRAATEGIDCESAALPDGARLRAVRTLRAVVRRLRPDVLHAHTSHAHGMARLATRRGEGPLVVVSRRTCSRPGRSWWARWKYTTGVDLYLAVAEAVGSALVAGGVEPDRVRVAHSAVDPRRFGGDPRSRAAAMSALELPVEARVVAAIGSLVALKAHEDLIEAFARLVARGRAEYLVILGEGPRRGALRERCAALGVAARTRLPGFRDDVGQLLPHFDVVAQPSLVEGLPNTVLDALMAGVPVVATPAGGTREILETGRVGGLIVPFRAPFHLAAALERLLDDRALAGQLAAAGRARVRSEFVPERMAAAVEAAYRAALASRRQAGVSRPITGALSGNGRARVWGREAGIAADLLARAGHPDGLPGAWPKTGERGAPRGPRRQPGDGRGPVRMLDLGGHAAVLKRHARGGLLGRVCRALSPEAPALTLGHRRLVRVTGITERFRARGGRTPPVLGWLSVRRGGPFRILYSATERIPGATSLAAVLADEPEGRRRLITELGAHLAWSHHAGLHHPDLNAGNILRSRGPAAGFWVIDLDRAGLGRQVGGSARARMVARLFRSLAHQGLEPRGREALRLVLVYARERTLLEALPHERRRELGRRLLRGLSWRRRLFVLHGLPRA